jgi:hypothetical protein
MPKIPRYEMSPTSGDPIPMKFGQWCKWEDVEKALSELRGLIKDYAVDAGLGELDADQSVSHEDVRQRIDRLKE